MDSAKKKKKKSRYWKCPHIIKADEKNTFILFAPKTPRFTEGPARGWGSEVGKKSTRRMTQKRLKGNSGKNNKDPRGY